MLHKEIMPSRTNQCNYRVWMRVHSSSRRGHALCAGQNAIAVEFVATPDLGQKEWKEPRQYAAVTIMFAIHYFFDSEDALKQLLHNVVINLKPGTLPATR